MTDQNNDKEKETKILEDFLQYIEDFNNEDIKGIRSHLADNLQMFVNGKMTGEGADKLLPFWQADMDKHRRVKCTQGPTIVLKHDADEDDGGQRQIAEITVELTATIPASDDGKTPEDVQVVPVVYVYDATTLKHIRHNITV